MSLSLYYAMKCGFWEMWGAYAKGTGLCLLTVGPSLAQGTARFAETAQSAILAGAVVGPPGEQHDLDSSLCRVAGDDHQHLSGQDHQNPRHW